MPGSQLHRKMYLFLAPKFHLWLLLQCEEANVA